MSDDKPASAQSGVTGDTSATTRLLTGLNVAKQTIDSFLNNRIEEAKRFVKSKPTGMYEELAYSTILFVQGTATLEQAYLTAATEHIRTALNACNGFRRKAAFGEVLTKQLAKRRISIYKEYTDEQAHAELCYAEALLQYSFLSMLQDEKLTSLIRSSLKVRQCYKCYRICWGILKHREWEDGTSKSAFASGVRLGVGAFNMMISLLPKKVLKLLEFVGFTGDRELGLTQLRLGASMQNSLRAPLSSLLLLVYNLYGTVMLGDTVTSVTLEKPERINESRELLDHWQKIYPDSAIFHLLRGRYQAISGNLDLAMQTFNAAVILPLDWKHYRHMCFWEMLWCYALQADWLSAVTYAEKLANESQWSQASYRYIMAAFLLQFLDDPGVSNPSSPDDGPVTPTNANSNQSTNPADIYQRVDELFTEIPQLIHRFAGRSLPMEKIALRKSKRYYAQNKRLTLPALELIFIWNQFKLIQCQQDSIMSFLMICENKINELVQHKDTYENYFDDYGLALLLKGVCLRCRGQTFQASMCYQEILELKKKFKVDTYLVPFCELELCQLSYDDNDIQQANIHLHRAQGYKNYNLESRLHFRIHELEMKLDPNSQKKNLARSKPSRSVSEIQLRDMRPNSGSSSVLSISGATGTSGAREGDSDVDSTFIHSGLNEFDDEFGEIDGSFSSEGSVE